MNIMTKRGTMDNIVTYEHYCDTTADLQNIDKQYLTLGSICVVVHGDTGLEVYMADSEHNLSLVSGSSSTNEEEEP